MIFVYNLGVIIYRFLIGIATLFNSKARDWVEGRKDWERKISDQIKYEKVIWFHCASLGEYEQAKPLIQKFRSAGDKILVTFFSPSGYERVVILNEVDYVFYLPLDTKFNAIKFINKVNPSKVFFVKYELWYNILYEVLEHNIPLYLVSATFRDDHFIFRWYASSFRKLLSKFNKVFVQDETSLKLLEKNGFNNAVLAGDTRFETVLSNKSNSYTDSIIEHFKNGSKIVLAGSCWAPEEDIMVELAKKYRSVKFIFAPHDISVEHVGTIEKRLTNYIKYSQIKDQDLSSYQSLIIDNIGILKNIYQYSDIVIVGGGFTNKLHNILEPAVFVVPVLFGGNVPKYPEAKLMVEENAGFSLSKEQVVSKIDELLQNEELRLKIGRNAYQFIERKANASEIIVSNL